MLSCKILIVDDDPDDRDILMENFRNNGIEEVHGVTSANEALNFLQEIKEDKGLPLLIITDYNMPGINGWEFLKTLKETTRFKNIPVFVFSTSKYDKYETKCLEAGATCYLNKPTLINEYISFAQKVVEIVK